MLGAIPVGMGRVLWERGGHCTVFPALAAPAGESGPNATVDEHKKIRHHRKPARTTHIPRSVGRSQQSLCFSHIRLPSSISGKRRRPGWSRVTGIHQPTPRAIFRRCAEWVVVGEQPLPQAEAKLRVTPARRTGHPDHLWATDAAAATRWSADDGGKTFEASADNTGIHAERGPRGIALTIPLRRPPPRGGAEKRPHNLRLTCFLSPSRLDLRGKSSTR